MGCVVNTCFQITSENPLLAVSLNKTNDTLGAIRENKRFSLSILAEDSDPALIGRFGFMHSSETDKYDGFGYVPCVNGRFAGRLILEAEQFIDCETHVLVVARLIDTVKGEGVPMTYAYYHNVVKGKAPKSAPTYRAEDDAPADMWPRPTARICRLTSHVLSVRWTARISGKSDNRPGRCVIIHILAQLPWPRF